MKKIVEQNHAGIFFLLTVGMVVALCMIPPVSQDLHYHQFADDKKMLGIPNFMNVLSNIPFLFVGVWGIIKISTLSKQSFPKSALLVFFGGVFLTGIGSAYYHLHPDNHTLLWDRLPMTITFMALFSAMVSFHMEEWSGKMMLVPALLIGTGSVVYWYMTELGGEGDLRPYIFVQFYPMLFIPLLVFLFPVKGIALRLLLPMIGCYVLAKYFEYSDHEWYALGNVLSGHTLKHLFAAMATVPVLQVEKLYQSVLTSE